MTRALSVIVSFALLAPLTSCNKPLNPIAPSWESKAGTQVLRLRWVKKLHSPVPNFLIPEMAEENDRFNPIETSSAAFDTDKKGAFVGASVGGLYCLDMRRGETVWRFELSDPVGSVPIYDPTRKYVFFGADDGKFYAVHARSGRLIWSVDTEAEIRRKAILFNDTLYFVNASSTVFAVDPEKGEIVWQYRRPPVEGFSAAGHAGLTMTGDKLITGFSDGYMVALDPIVGSEIWTQDLAAEGVQIVNKAEGFAPGQFDRLHLEINLADRFFPDARRRLEQYLRDAYLPYSLRRQGEGYCFDLPKKALKKKILFDGFFEAREEGFSASLQVGPKFDLLAFLRTFGQDLERHAQVQVTELVW